MQYLICSMCYVVLCNDFLSGFFPKDIQTILQSKGNKQALKNTVLSNVQFEKLDQHLFCSPKLNISVIAL